MKFKPLGRTDLEVSEICLGTMTWGRQNSEADAHAQIDYALESGINFMDTAEMYAIPPTAETFGKTEEMIGTWFKKTGKRDQWILASKITGSGKSYIRGGGNPDKNALHVAVEDSLTRLQTDYLDLYQLHWPARRSYNFENYWLFRPERNDPQQSRDHIFEMVEGMTDLVKAGKIRHFGVSNETAWGLMRYLSAAEIKQLIPIASVQNEYSLLRRHIDHDIAEVCLNEKISLLAYSPLSSGVLTGKYFNGAIPAGSRGELQGGLFRNSPLADAATHAYHDLAAANGLHPCQMALAFCLSRPFITSTIIGATSMEQLKTNIGSTDVELEPTLLRKIDAIHREQARPV